VLVAHDELDKSVGTVKTVTVSGLPKREDVDANINEQLIVELYSK